MRIKRTQVATPTEKPCPQCGRMRTIEAMPKHYRIKHPKKRLPDEFDTGPRDMLGNRISEYSGKFLPGTRVKIRGFRKNHRLFAFYPEFDEDVRGMKGTVYDVTPESYGGKGTPPVIHVKTDKPIETKYYLKYAGSFLERELKRLKKQ